MASDYQRIKNIVSYRVGKILRTMQNEAPIDTGWLSSSIQLVKVAPSKWKIEVPYAVVVDDRGNHYLPYTNEKWTSPKWGGAQNPNEGWWNAQCEKAINEIVNAIYARYSKETKGKDDN